VRAVLFRGCCCNRHFGVLEAARCIDLMLTFLDLNPFACVVGLIVDKVDLSGVVGLVCGVGNVLSQRRVRRRVPLSRSGRPHRSALRSATISTAFLLAGGKQAQSFENVRGDLERVELRLEELRIDVELLLSHLFDIF